MHSSDVTPGAAMLLVVSTLVAAFASEAAAQEASSAVYLRVDTDHTTVVNPRLRIGDTIEDTRLDVTYSVDIWTAASIDIRTSASKAVTEQRDELDVSARHELRDASVQASYRYSTEPDYESHGVTIGGGLDFAGKATTVGMALSAMADRVGRKGDPAFDRGLQTFDLRADATQIVDTITWLQLVYEISLADGFLASPYRFIGIGNETLSCRLPGAVCIREALPERRWRHATALQARRALSARWAAGASYRFYVDDWDLLAHTLTLSASVMPGDETQLALEYRGYLQTAARYYLPWVGSIEDVGTFASRDKELSPFMSHRISFTLDTATGLGRTGKLHLGAMFGPTVYLFSDFFAYDHVVAFEGTLALRAEL